MNKNKFDTTKSSTWNNGHRFKVVYGSGDVAGILGYDDVSLGDPKKGQFMVKKTTVGVAETMDSTFSNQPEVDGIMGLAFQDLAALKRPTAFMDAYNQKLVDEPVFTIWMKGQSSNSNVRVAELKLKLSLGKYWWTDYLWWCRQEEL